MTYFGRVQPQLILLAEGVSVGQLLNALKGSDLAASSQPGGSLVIHRLVKPLTHSQVLTLNSPPSPETAA